MIVTKVKYCELNLAYNLKGSSRAYLNPRN